jgi:hypothetical protein
MSDAALPPSVTTLESLYAWLGPALGAVRTAFVTAYCEARAAMGVREMKLSTHLTLAWDGGFSPRTGRRTPCAWVQLAAFCQQHNVDPVLYAAYIGRVLGARGLDRRSLLVATFVPSFHAEAARAGGGSQYADAQLQAYLGTLQIEMGKLRNTPGYLDDTARMREALSCVDVGPALFRYCVAVRYGITEVAHALYRTALREYRANRSQLTRGWSAIIPDEWQRLSVADLAARTEAAL